MVKIDKEALFELMWSHSMLITVQTAKGLMSGGHPARVAEVKMFDALRESGWLDEFTAWRREK